MGAMAGGSDSDSEDGEEGEDGEESGISRPDGEGDEEEKFPEEAYHDGHTLAREQKHKSCRKGRTHNRRRLPKCRACHEKKKQPASK